MSFEASSNSWVPVGTAGFSVGEANYISLALDDNGIPYVAYQDSNKGNKVTVMSFEAGSKLWIPVGSAGFSSGEARYLSLALGSNPNFTSYVAYQDLANDNKLTVMSFEASSNSWIPVGSIGFSDGAATYVSLCISGSPYVAYRDAGNNNKATVMRWLNNSWIPVGSTGFSSGEVMYTCLCAISGSTYAAYQDGGNGARTTVVRDMAEGWVPQGNLGFSSGQANYLSMDLNSTNLPYIAYQDVANSSKATVMKYSSGTWEVVGGTGFSDGTASDISLAVDISKAYIAYKDGAHNNKLTIMKYDP
jgi:hypothetical protein